MRSACLTLALLVSVCAAGCPSDAPRAAPSPSPVPETNPRHDRAKAAAKALGTRLKARLKEALSKDGFAGGITACKIAAPEIAAAVSAEQSLKVGRTSFKLRNPQNAPPAWAAEWVAARTETPSFADGPDGSLRALLPIRIEPLCLTCHGAKETLPGEVEAALAEHYPDDQATGFNDGDLRGWFWVELPPG